MQCMLELRMQQYILKAPIRGAKCAKVNALAVIGINIAEYIRIFGYNAKSKKLNENVTCVYVDSSYRRDLSYWKLILRFWKGKYSPI